MIEFNAVFTRESDARQVRWYIEDEDGGYTALILWRKPDGWYDTAVELMWLQALNDYPGSVGVTVGELVVPLHRYIHYPAAQEVPNDPE